LKGKCRAIINYLTVLEPTLPVAPATNTKLSSLESVFSDIPSAVPALDFVEPCIQQGACLDSQKKKKEAYFILFQINVYIFYLRLMN